MRHPHTRPKSFSERVRNLRAETHVGNIFESLVLDSPQGINDKLVKDGEEDQAFMQWLMRVDVDQVSR